MAMTLRDIAQERGGWFGKGRAAFEAGEPISNSPRTPDTILAKRWREGWLWARDRGTDCPTCKGSGKAIGLSHVRSVDFCPSCGGTGEA
jgi:hypothetical protein